MGERARAASEPGKADRTEPESTPIFDAVFQSRRAAITEQPEKTEDSVPVRPAPR